MAVIIGAWLILLTASLGFGGLFEKLVAEDQEESSLPHQVILGVSLLACGALLVSAFSPLREFPGVCLLVIGLAFGLWRWLALARSKPPGTLTLGALVLLAVLIFVAWPLASTSYCNAYDTNLYHLQQVRWMRSQGTPLGLTNLHARFGIQSSFLALAAILEQGFFAGRSAWFMPAVFPLLGLWWCLALIQRGVWERGNLPVAMYGAAVMGCLVPQVLLPQPELYFDNAAGIVQIILVGECLYLFCGRAAAPRKIRKSKSFIVILSTFCVTLKFSAAMTVAVCLIFALCANWRIQPRKGVFIVSAIVMMGYVARSIMLSGWILFPFPLGRLSVDWAMPMGEPGTTRDPMSIQTVVGFFEIVRAWARLPGPGFHSAVSGGLSAWWPTWSAAFWETGEWRLLKWAGAASLVALVRNRSGRHIREIVFLTGFGLLPLVYWFQTAPDLRFGAMNFWVLWALSITFAAARCERAQSAVIALSLISVAWTWYPALSRSGAPMFINTPRAASLPTVERVVSGGARVRVPAPSEGDRCGNARLPCTPYSRANLVIERKGGRYHKFALQGILPRTETESSK